MASATLIQEVVPPEMLGRVFGLFGSSAGFGALAVALVAAPLVGRSSPAMSRP